MVDVEPRQVTHWNHYTHVTVMLMESVQTLSSDYTHPVGRLCETVVLKLIRNPANFTLWVYTKTLKGARVAPVGLLTYRFRRSRKRKETPCRP